MEPYRPQKYYGVVITLGFCENQRVFGKPYETLEMADVRLR